VDVSVIKVIGGAMVSVLDFKTVSGTFSLLTSLLPQAGRIKVADNNKSKTKFLVVEFKGVLQKNLWTSLRQLFYPTSVIS